MFQTFYQLRAQPFGVNPEQDAAGAPGFSSVPYTDLSSFLAMIAQRGMGTTTLLSKLLQILDCVVLETVRRPSDFQTQQWKLGQIFPSGQSELGAMLAQVGVQQLRQRLSCLVQYLDCGDGNCSGTVEIRACAVQWQTSGFTRYGAFPISLA
jgi:hypothetical protein